MSEAIRVLIVDDHPIVLDGLCSILATQPDLQVVQRAASGPDALRTLASARPDVVLLDLEMPEMSGIEVLEKMLELSPEVKVLVFTAFDTDERILAALQTGARGYMLKGAPREELFHAIRVVHAGGSLLQPVVASRLLAQSQKTSPAKASHSAALPEPLTPRQREVLQLLARGLQNKEIGSELGMKERTVKFHVSALLRKLDVDNRTEAVTRAVQLGLIEL